MADQDTTTTKFNQHAFSWNAAMIYALLTVVIIAIFGIPLTLKFFTNKFFFYFVIAIFTIAFARKILK